MKDKENLPSLENLQARIDEVRGEQNPEPNRAPDPTRIGLELVSGVAVGGALGFYLDKWLGTKPFLFIILLMLGAVAGFLNVYRLVSKPSDDEEKSEEKK